MTGRIRADTIRGPGPFNSLPRPNQRKPYDRSKPTIIRRRGCHRGGKIGTNTRLLRARTEQKVIKQSEVSQKLNPPDASRVRNRKYFPSRKAQNLQELPKKQNAHLDGFKKEGWKIPQLNFKLNPNGDYRTMSPVCYNSALSPSQSQLSWEWSHDYKNNDQLNEEKVWQVESKDVIRLREQVQQQVGQLQVRDKSLRQMKDLLKEKDVQLNNQSDRIKALIADKLKKVSQVESEYVIRLREKVQQILEQLQARDESLQQMKDLLKEKDAQLNNQTNQIKALVADNLKLTRIIVEYETEGHQSSDQVTQDSGEFKTTVEETLSEGLCGTPVCPPGWEIATENGETEHFPQKLAEGKEGC